MNTIHIIGGGTVAHVRNHLALTAPAYGSTARKLFDLVANYTGYYNALANQREYGYWKAGVPDVQLHLTKMANEGKGNLETNEDISNLIDTILADKLSKIIFFNPALVDYAGSIATSGPVGYEWSDEIPTRSGKYEERLKTSDGKRTMLLTPTDKLVNKIRSKRKDIFLVAFKTTCGASEDEQFLTGLHLLKANSCNLVLANDTKTRVNMIITPEQARYGVTTDRDTALTLLVGIALERSKGTFTRSEVVEGDSVDWNSDMVPSSLRKVVNHCIAKGAYKPFQGSTVGHFASKVDENTFLTSKRKTNFNKLNEVGLVKIESNGENSVIAYGAKPSVGGQSQRIIFKEHPEMDCIVHFHCPTKLGVKISTRPQQNVECGSHQCGQNTSNGLKEESPGIKCVYLDNHGPNIVFNREMDPDKVIEFIDNNFDLHLSTDKVNRNKHQVE